MADSPLVTIGLPVYNSERYLEESLKSLLAQTYSEFVLIISDNASTDGTPAICQKYADADPRVKYYRNDSNIGNPGNFNRIFELCKTRYLKGIRFQIRAGSGALSCRASSPSAR